MSNEMVLDSGLNDQLSSQTNESLAEESVEVSRDKLQQCLNSVNSNSSVMHPIQTFEDENIDENIYEFINCICICYRWDIDDTMPKTFSISFKGIVSGRLSKEGWKD
ncbi:hypothetical protein V6N13_148512 [Hibiscus sabdariffa]